MKSDEFSISVGISTLTAQRKSFLCGIYPFPLEERTYLMGVLNITPDSFSGDGFFREKDFLAVEQKAIELAQKMVQAGADIIDVGGESSRPGALPVSEQEELNRVIPIVKVLTHHLKVPVSVDTYKSTVAEEALKNGASMINDITGLRGSPEMASLIASYHAGVVIMHMQGEDPQTMQKAPSYQNLIGEICDFFQQSLQIAEKGGISKEQILLDPGIGFGKRVEHNLEILRNLQLFKKLEYPLLIGTSRKSFIGKVLQGRPVERRIWGTAATVALAVYNGANVIRVHDVSEMKDVVCVCDAVLRNGGKG